MRDLLDNFEGNIVPHELVEEPCYSCFITRDAEVHISVVLRELNSVSFCSPELAFAEAQILTIIFAAFIVLIIITAWEQRVEKEFPRSCCMSQCTISFMLYNILVANLA